MSLRRHNKHYRAFGKRTGAAVWLRPRVGLTTPRQRGPLTLGRRRCIALPLKIHNGFRRRQGDILNITSPRQHWHAKIAVCSGGSRIAGFFICIESALRGRQYKSETTPRVPIARLDSFGGATVRHP